MSQKGFGGIIILIVVLVVAGLGGAYYFGKSQTLKPQNQIIPQIPQPTITPSPTPDASPVPNGTGETANWKTFSSKFGYTFKYPNNTTATIMSTSSDPPSLKEVVNIHFTDDSRSSFSGFNDWVYISSNLGIIINDLSAWKEWCNKLEQQAPIKFECDNWDKLSPTEINGYKAFQRSGGRDSSLVRVIYLPYGDYVYEVNLDDGDPEKLQYWQLNNQILSTFKFTQ